MHSLRRQAAGIEGHTRQVEDGCAHVHRDAAVRLHARLDDAGQGPDPDHVLVRQALLAHKTQKAACAVAALLDLAAIGVVDHVFKINTFAGRRPHRQDLVGTHAEVAVRQKAVLARRQIEALARLVKHDKIVARTLHLGKSD